ncbi:LAFA_0E18624g1_1 [Lachancea sp. 'fantastica']|nr:LAFA_0E18624g1_1 [Lachancea sp. 'fantastica']
MTETSVPKTQILITDVPHHEFADGWPQKLQKQLFEQKFPELKSRCQYYTPLAFLNRVVLIFDEEQATLPVYHFLVEQLESKKPIKVFLTESLLTRPRSRSHDTSATDEVDFQTFKKPQLSLETQNTTSASSSLSPERIGTLSPTAMKFPEDGKIHYYQEPLPKPEHHEEGNSKQKETKLLHQSRLSLNTSNTGQSSESVMSTPASPSITLNEFKT